MRVARIEVWHVALPLLEPWRTACGDEHATGSVLVRLTADGAAGWGEATPFGPPYFSPEWAGGVFRTVERALATAVVGREVDVFPSDRFYARDLAAPPVEFVRGEEGGVFALAGSAPAPDPELLAAWAVEHAVVEAP